MNKKWLKIGFPIITTCITTAALPLTLISCNSSTNNSNNNNNNGNNNGSSNSTEPNEKLITKVIPKVDFVNNTKLAQNISKNLENKSENIENVVQIVNRTSDSTIKYISSTFNNIVGTLTLTIELNKYYDNEGKFQNNSKQEIIVINGFKQVKPTNVQIKKSIYASELISGLNDVGYQTLNNFLAHTIIENNKNSFETNWLDLNKSVFFENRTFNTIPTEAKFKFSIHEQNQNGTFLNKSTNNQTSLTVNITWDKIYDIKGELINNSNQTNNTITINGFAPYKNNNYSISMVNNINDVKNAYKILWKENASIVAIIPYGIDYIGDDAFEQNQNLKEISFPKTLKIIGNAFFNNNNLSKVNLPENSEINRIYDNSFVNCSKLTNFDFSKLTNLVSIGSYNAFNKTKINKIVISSQKIESQSFNDLLFRFGSNGASEFIVESNKVDYTMFFEEKNDRYFFSGYNKSQYFPNLNSIKFKNEKSYQSFWNNAISNELKNNHAKFQQMGKINEYYEIKLLS